ncbi:ATP synthase F0 subunit A [Aquimarina sp. BL5]|uniref:F0F1 ATP synthase subunit A n=1 Tax=Aquimarina sp. BL5 TaxID=1714860 RepID=UPI000E4ED7C8|nr:F0F1 ATP synthase subunit A [Aquimarina sp. BL5]AXT51926.1 ATP synthase F0 subunit A [Aquimarina sp. BL5]RKN02952.1 ATP synthase F0 subunit A [Aquimarina sp. BL5]
MMIAKSIKNLILVLFLSMPVIAMASDKKEEKEGFNVVEMIMHHIADSHEWHIYGEGEDALSIPLPVILYTDNGIVSFLSSEFHHDDAGKLIVSKKGMNFVKLHGKIYQLNSDASSVTFDEEHHPTNAIKPLDFSITKNVTSMFISVFLLVIIFSTVARSYKKSLVPSGFTGLMEPLIVFVRDDIAKSLINEKKYQKYVPYLLTLFFFIWVNNLLGLMPTGANLTGNIATTMVLAVLTLLIVNFSGNKNYWKHIFWMPGVPAPMKLILAPIEFVGIFTKPFALMIRLFANITAGHIIILSLVSLIFIFKWAGTPSMLLAVFIMILEFVVAFVQAYIFTFLTALFIGMAVEEDHH